MDMQVRAFTGSGKPLPIAEASSSQSRHRRASLSAVDDTGRSAGREGPSTAGLHHRGCGHRPCWRDPASGHTAAAGGLPRRRRRARPNDTAKTTIDRPVRIRVLANDKPADGGSFIYETLGVDTVRNGSVVVDPAADGSLVYTPDPGFVGTDTLDYSIVDNWGARVVGTAMITVDAGCTITGDLPGSGQRRSPNRRHTMAMM